MSGETRLPPPATFRRSEKQGGILLAPLATFLAGMKDPSHLIKLAGILERYRTPTSYHRYDFRIVESSDLPPAGSPAEDDEELRKIWTRERGSPVIIDDEVSAGVDGEKGAEAMDVDEPNTSCVGATQDGGGEVPTRLSPGAAPEKTHEPTASPQEASNGAHDAPKETETPENAIAEHEGSASASSSSSRPASPSAPDVNVTEEGAKESTADTPTHTSETERPDVRSRDAPAAAGREAHAPAPSNSRTPGTGASGTQDERSAARPEKGTTARKTTSTQSLQVDTSQTTSSPSTASERDAAELMVVDEEAASGPTACALAEPRNGDSTAPSGENTAAPASMTPASGTSADGAADDVPVTTDTNDNASPVEDSVQGAAPDCVAMDSDPPADKVPSAGDASTDDAPASDVPAGDAPAGDAPTDNAPADDAPADDAPADDTARDDDDTHAPRSPSPFTPAFPPPPGGTARCNRELRLDLRTLDVAALFQLEVWRREELGLEPLDMLVPASKWYHVEEPPSPPKKKGGRLRKSQAAPNASDQAVDAGTAAEPIVVDSDATPRTDGIDTPAAPVDLTIAPDTPGDGPVFGPELRPATPPPRTPTPDIILPDGFDDDTAADPDFLPPPSLSKPRGRPRGSGRGRGGPRGGRGGRPLDSRPTPDQTDTQTPDLTVAAAEPSGLDETNAIEVDPTPPPTAQRVDTMHVPIHSSRSSHSAPTCVIEVARPPSVDAIPPALEPDVNMGDADHGASEHGSAENVSDSRGNGKRRRSHQSPRRRAISSEHSETASAASVASLDDPMVVDLEDDTSADAIGPASMSVEARSAPAVAATSTSSSATATATAREDRDRPRRGTFARRAVWRKPERGRGPHKGPDNKVSGEHSDKVGTIGVLRRMRARVAEDQASNPAPGLFSFTPCEPRQYLECVEIISARRSPSMRALSIVPKAEVITPRLKSEVVTPRITRSTVGTPASLSDIRKPAIDSPRATPPASSTKRRATRGKKRPRADFEDEPASTLAALKVEAATPTLPNSPDPAAHAVVAVGDDDDDDEEWGCLKGL